MIIDWFFVLTFVVIGLIAWGAVALLGALVVGKAIRIADEREQPSVSTSYEPPDEPAEPVESVQRL